MILLVRRSRQLALGTALVSFALSTSFAVVSMAAHTPFRGDIGSFPESISSKIGEPKQNWRAVHILLSSGCDCSRRVAEYLIRRGVHSGLQEHVLLIGRNAALSQRLAQAGFTTTDASEDEIARDYKLHGVPWLLLQQPGGGVRYAGGYSAERRTEADYQDLAIWKALTDGNQPQSLPAYGCALSAQLKKRIDPFGLKYESVRSE